MRVNQIPKARLEEGFSMRRPASSAFSLSNPVVPWGFDYP
jgi:hypothetical protein